MRKIIFIFISLIIIQTSYAQEWTLDGCINFGIANNKTLLAKGNRIAVSNYGKKAAKSNLLPEIEFNSSLDYYWKIPVQYYPGELVGQAPGTSTAIPIGTNWMSEYNFDLKMNIINVEAWQNIKLSTLIVQADKASLSSIEKILIRNITMSYYSAQINKVNLDVAQKSFSDYKIVHSTISSQYEKGITDKISLNQSKNILNDHKNTIIENEKLYKRSLVELKFWMGMSLDAPINIPDFNDKKVQDGLSTLTNEDFIIENLPDYDEKMYEVEIQRQRYKIVKSAYYPKLSLIGQYGQLGFSNKFNSLGKSESWYPSGFIGLQLSIPIVSVSKIFTARKNKALISHYEMNFLSYQEEAKKQYFDKSIGLNSAWNIYRNSCEQLLCAEENEKLCIEKVNKGIINMLELNQIQQELIQHQNKKSKAYLNYLNYIIEVSYLQNK